MDINTANLRGSSWQLEAHSRQLAVSNWQLNTKYGSFIVPVLLIAFCSLSFTKTYSQDSLTSRYSPLATYPTDLDSAKVDSFFSEKGISLRDCNNRELYFEIFRWYRTCYRYGGNSQQGVDCSHFVNMLCEKIYGKKLIGSSASIYEQCKPRKGGLEKAGEGDLVFFKIKKKRISHIGIYLQNGRFAHASVQLGVIISNMEESYYKKRFYKVAVAE
jgi:lipoprotein Spr